MSTIDRAAEVIDNALSEDPEVYCESSDDPALIVDRVRVALERIEGRAGSASSMSAVSGEEYFMGQSEAFYQSAELIREAIFPNPTKEVGTDGQDN